MNDLVLKKMTMSVLISYLHVSLLYLLQLFFFHDFYLAWFQGVSILKYLPFIFKEKH